MQQTRDKKGCVASARAPSRLRQTQHVHRTRRAVHPARQPNRRRQAAVEHAAVHRRVGRRRAGAAAALRGHPPHHVARLELVVAVEGALRGQVMRDEFGAPFRDWRPETPRVDQTALVGCIVDIRSEIETCQYDGGRMLHRVRVDRAVRVFSLQTGQLVGETLLAGGMPDGCHSLEEFYGSGDNTRAGTVPSDEDVVAYLRPLIGR